ncbi:amino acid ABC transporter permease [Bartonella sp. HY038]|uniref:amino acid ABC transporter permease n=1 Tax=Bartonella sp. HY038 TaxID=2759660 RepID=UPI0015FD9684|nr:amino acid ABC transporter permease [Bartonella sp. HY038]
MEKISAFTRKQLLPALPPPKRQSGILHWLKRRLFANPLDGLITIFLLIALIYTSIPTLRWLFIDASWIGNDRAACATIIQGGIQPNGWSGACWAFVRANMSSFLYGIYPQSELWRVHCALLLVIIVNIPLLMPRVRFKVINALLSFIFVPIFCYILLYGGAFGLTSVPTARWGGLLATLIIAYSSIIVSLPLGTLLALGRQSKKPIIHFLCVIFIETLRGVPLVAVLFVANVMLPLFFPQDLNFDNFLRALIAVALFTSVYIAEVIRGGLQAVPKAQYEAAWSLGLRYWQMISFIIVPQAFRLVIPGVINILIGMFKDTSLIYTINMQDLLGAAQNATLQPNWISPVTPATAYIFAGFIFWLFCFAMSRYAHFIERHLNASRKLQN